MKSGIWGFWNLVLTIGVFLEYLDLQIGFLESSVQVARFGVRVLIWESLVLPCSRKWVEILFFYAVWGSIGVLVILGILGLFDAEGFCTERLSGCCKFGFLLVVEEGSG
ncbi:hypothetical protein VIGAN_05186100 [Vigna angularis var. angularis]|uniref:Transmembrane protein n=1 Tax=Vigna angularis var. angularis TaxID=157739 RepID=A0A0S3S6E0_PHAAN|nr:hypothetical protein VIGAN_05186100 [Vigna angularis var. angularis]